MIYSDLLLDLWRIKTYSYDKKAEPFKRWLAQVGAERIQQMQDPELGIQQSLMDYKRLGYSDNWINQRLKSIEIRKDLTDQWKAHNVEDGVGYATLTDIIYFIGNLYKQVKDPNLVGALSGHKEGSRAFARYREIDEDMKRDLVSMLE